MNWYKLAQESKDINEIASSLEFKQTRKKATPYKFFPIESPKDVDSMPDYSYGQYRGPNATVKTMVSSGEETSREISDGMIIISGVNKEKYFMTPQKFSKNYTGNIGGEVVPEQSPRNVARYSGSETINFMASYGSPTTLIPGDFLVKEDNGYYRIAKEEFEKTYEF